MPRRSNAADMLPPPVERALITLGEHLYIARKRRKQTLSSFADRMQVSVPTLRKMKRGDQLVSISVYAMALWLLGEYSFSLKSPIRSVMKWPYCLNCAIFPPNKKELHGEQCAVRLDLSTKCAQACAMRHTRFDRWSAVLVFLRGQMASEQKRICSVAGSAA